MNEHSEYYDGICGGGGGTAKQRIKSRKIQVNEDRVLDEMADLWR